MITSGELLELQKKVETIVCSSGDYAFHEWKSVAAIQKGEEGDIVTKVDDEIESQISKELENLIHGAWIVGEEHGGEVKNGYVWLIDPIDGTKHYAHFMPSFYVQVSLLFDGMPILGVIFDPVSKQLFSASKGNGVYINGERITDTHDTPIEKSVIDIDFGGKELLHWKSKVLQELAHSAYRVRMSAGRFAVYLLTGGIHAYVVLNPTTKLWDQAPRIILFQEAGFSVEQFDVHGHKVILASTGELFLKIKQIIMKSVD